MISGDYREGAREFAASRISHENAFHRSSISSRLHFELFALGLSDPRLLPELANFLEEGRRGVERALDDAGMSHGPGIPALLLARFNGLALQKLTVPDLQPAREPLASLIRRNDEAAS
ncbi:MAG: hypothetical protein ACRDSJ_14995 [Rubrobacteraceae bacterium]